MIGRDAAPGAKLDPVMPGLENSRSPSVLDGVRRSSSFGIDRDGRELVGDDRQRADERGRAASRQAAAERARLAAERSGSAPSR